VEQELPTLPEHMSSPPVFSGVRVTRYLVLYVCFVDRCLSFCAFSYTITYFSYTNKMMQCGLDIVTKNKKTIHHVQHGCYFLSHHTLVYESFSVFTLLSKKSLKIPKGGNQNPINQCVLNYWSN
jgi:hypothetical protein